MKMQLDPKDVVNDRKKILKLIENKKCSELLEFFKKNPHRVNLPLSVMGDSAYLLLCEDGICANVIEYMLENSKKLSFDKNVKGWYEENALQSSVKYLKYAKTKDYTIFDLLIKYKVNPNVMDFRRETPLITGIDDLYITEALLKNGALVNFGAYNPVWNTVFTGNVNQFKLLMKYNNTDLFSENYFMKKNLSDLAEELTKEYGKFYYSVTKGDLGRHIEINTILQEYRNQKLNEEANMLDLICQRLSNFDV